MSCTELARAPCCRSEKTRKLRELHEELTTLDTDIQQVAAQAGPCSIDGPPRAPERPSDAELLRRRIAETADRPLGGGALPALPGFPGKPLYLEAFCSIQFLFLAVL